MNTNPAKTDYLTRDAILKLLSDDEIARVSTMEAGPRLGDGEEYIDLHNPHLGVRCMNASTRSTMGQILPRSAVGQETWATICSRLVQ
jgi:hypothetical protein